MLKRSSIISPTVSPLADDSFCVKDGSSNMLFERLTSSGLGLTIGSIGGSTVRNITFRSRTHSHDSASLFHSLAALTSLVFRNVYMPNTFKVEPPPPARPSRRDHTPCRASTSNFAAAAASSPTFCTNPKQPNRPNAPRSTSCVKTLACTRTWSWTHPRSTSRPSLS